MATKRKHNPKFTHEAKMVVTNLNPKKIPADPLSGGFKYVEVEITDRKGVKTKSVVSLHSLQIEGHRK